MSKTEELQEAERAVLTLAETWCNSDYMRVRVTHRDLAELVHPVEVSLYHAVCDLQLLREPRDAPSRGKTT